MARAPAALPDADELRRRLDPQGRLAIKVTPGARDEGVTLTETAVLVKVRAPADKGAANQAVVAVVARAMGLAPSRVVLVRGGTSRQKVLQVTL
jgi:uncharacterized protein (TIGR00251 family)